MEYEPKNWTEDDVEIAITHCGVCGSDVHTLSSGWGEAMLPLVVGHEIIGHATRVGTNVQGVNVGDRVGVGAQIYSCLKCRACKTDNENYCPEQVDTYVSVPSDFDSLGNISPLGDLPKFFVFCSSWMYAYLDPSQNATYPDGVKTMGG